MKNYEYKLEEARGFYSSPDIKDIQNKMNDVAEQGWEYFGFLPHGNTDHPSLVFRRER